MRKLPDLEFGTEDFCINDPKRVRLLATALDVPYMLRPPAVDDKPSMLFVPYTRHPTHWILFCSFSGIAELENNGLTVIGQPKRIYPVEILDFLIGYMTQGRPCKVHRDVRLGPSNS